MRIRRTLFVALLAFALAMPNLPIQAEAVEGYEITYLRWDTQSQSYVAVGQEVAYCDMGGEESWGETEFGLDDCGVIKDELRFACRGSSYTYQTLKWTGLTWIPVQEGGCVA